MQTESLPCKELIQRNVFCVICYVHDTYLLLFSSTMYNLTRNPLIPLINVIDMDNDSPPYLVIEPKLADKNYLRDLFRYKDLFFLLAWRDIAVRYKQAAFGAAWALFRPIISMVVFVIIFGKIAHLPSMGVDYSLFVLAGLLPWIFFSSTMVETTTCLINNTNLITKIYFPRMLIPLAQIMVNLLDFSIATLLLFILGGFSGSINWLTVLSLPIWITLMIFLNVGVGLWLSALTVKYRDVRILAPFLIQFGMFISPVGYGSFVIPEKWQLLSYLNPLVGIIDGFRWAFFGISYPNMPIAISISAAVTAFLVISGFFFFRKLETKFADII